MKLVRVCRFCGEELEENDKWDCKKHLGWFEIIEAYQKRQIAKSKVR